MGRRESVAEENYGGLAAVEWGFHVTLVIGAFFVAAFVWQALRSTPAGSDRAPATQPVVAG